MHGIVLNILHSLTMLPELSHSGEHPLYTVGGPVRVTITLYPIGRLLELLLYCTL